MTEFTSRKAYREMQEKKYKEAAKEVVEHLFSCSRGWDNEREALALLGRELLAFSVGELDEKEMPPPRSRFLKSIRARCSNDVELRSYEERYIAALVVEQISKEVADLIRIGLMRLV